MIEHMPWIGSNYEKGIDGQKVAISGVIAHVPWVGMVSRAAGSGRIFGSTTALGYESRVA